MLWTWGRQLISTLYETYQEWLQDDGAQQAASVSYYMALSFFPFLMIVFSSLSVTLQVTGWGRTAREEVLGLVASQTAPELADQVRQVLASAKDEAATSGPLGLALLLIGASAVFAQFERAFDRVWNIPAPATKGVFAALRTVLWERLRAFLLLFGMGLFVLTGFVVTMSLSAIQTLMTESLPMPASIWSLITAMAAITMNWLLFTLVYRILPKVPIRWSEAARGALLTAVLWEVGRRVLASYVISSNYSVYGVVGAFIAVMLWVYYAVSVVILGAEFVQVMCRNCRGRADSNGLSELSTNRRPL